MAITRVQCLLPFLQGALAFVRLGLGALGASSSSCSATAAVAHTVSPSRTCPPEPHVIGRPQHLRSGAAQRPGVDVVELTVTEGNTAAIGLYEAAGFRAWGTQRDVTDRKRAEELLREGDRRNVVEAYRYWRHDAIVADLLGNFGAHSRNAVRAILKASNQP